MEASIESCIAMFTAQVKVFHSEVKGVISKSLGGCSLGASGMRPERQLCTAQGWHTALSIAWHLQSSSPGTYHGDLLDFSICVQVEGAKVYLQPDTSENERLLKRVEKM